MGNIITCICCNCKRIIPLNDLTIFEGRDYHDSCYLKTVRTRISELDKKSKRGTITLLDNIELSEQLEIERSVKKDMENPDPSFDQNPETPIFFGNSPLGLSSIYNPPTWKRLLRKNGTLEGTKYHMHKKEIEVKTSEPIFQIMTGEDGHKYALQIGSKPVEDLKQIEEKNKPSFPLEQKEADSKNMDNKKVNTIGEPSPTGLPPQVENTPITVFHDSYNQVDLGVNQDA